MENIQNKKRKTLKKFSDISEKVNDVVGSPYWFFFSISLIVVWLFSGFLIGFGDTWQLIINTTTTIMTFLMMSLLHSSQRKWEDKIERMQNKEVSHIQEISKTTKEIASETQHTHKDIYANPDTL